MKTPKRTCRDCLFFTSYSSADPDGRCGEGCGTYGTHTKGSEAACNVFMLSSAAKSARRKRKNKLARLKRSLTRYKHGTNLPFYSHELHAYLLLQQLSRPSENAAVKKWGSYILELSAICEHIEEAIAWAHYAKRRKQEKENAACHPETAENGQQTNIPPTGGQQTTHP